ncbi:hypothetical protein [Planktothrix phage Pra-JY27]|nr:hypothetical protein [Planktothrix phage Pag-Yong1]WEV89240.1 hypothetical protein [Synechococcus phage MinM2]
MSVGSHFSIHTHDQRLLNAAVKSMARFRKRYAPYARFVYRRTRKGYTFWRVE